MKTFAFDGASGRAVEMYARPIHDKFSASARAVGVSDVNQTRAHRLAGACGNPPIFADFDTIKSTHHFDLINWWIDDEPQRVSAFGELRFYSPTRAERGERCSTCDYTKTCEFFKDYANDPGMKVFYFDAEHEDGYWRDGCVFSDRIDIYDTMSVRYGRGVLLNYSLNAHCAYEGWRAAINGTKGRMELLEIESGPGSDADAMDIVLPYPNGKRAVERVPASEGGHGGGGERLLHQLFSGEDIPDPLGHMAGSRAGAMSILIGIAANQSIARGSVVRISDLLEGL